MKRTRMPSPWTSEGQNLAESRYFWQPATEALRNAIPAQYPNEPLPEYSSLEELKPIRIALLRAVRGGIPSGQALDEACVLVDELIRPCDPKNWSLDPRCLNPKDNQQGCPPGSHFVRGKYGVIDCKACPLGTAQDQRQAEETCNSCPPGRFAAEPGRSECVTCAPGWIATNPGMSACFTCNNGSMPVNGEACQACEAGEYEAFGLCQPCPSGYTSTRGSFGSDSCVIQNVLFLWNGLLIMGLVFLCMLLPRLLGFGPLPIQDLFVDEGRVVVKAWGAHGMCNWFGLPLQVRLTGTGHPAVEECKGIFRAVVRNSDELWLLDRHSKERLAADIESSRGALRLCFPCSLWCSSFGSLPLALPAVILVTCNIWLVWQLVLGWEAEVDLCLWWFLLGLAIALALCVAVTLRQRRNGLASVPLTRRLTQFHERILHANPQPAAAERGPARAIHAEKIVALYEYFQSFIRRRTMHYVGYNLLMPLTASHKLSYAELVGPAQVAWFVSHCWSMPFADFVQSIRALGDTKTDWRKIALWVCSFSNNQWAVEDELGGGDPMDSSFGLALLSPSCRGTAMVLDAGAEPLQRSWCLFEVFQTFRLAKQHADHQGLLLCTPTGVLQQGTASVDMVLVLAKKLASIRMEDAQASRPQDKINIDACVQATEGGFPAVNRFVRQCIKTALDNAHSSFQGHYTALVALS